jgi:hypothetical protein
MIPVTNDTNGDIGISSIVWNADSNSVLIGGPTGHLNGVFEITDLNHKPQVRVAYPKAFAVASDADGKRVIVAYQAALRVFDGQDQKPVGGDIALPTTAIIGIASAPNGRVALVSSLQGWRLVDLKLGQSITPWMPMYFPSTASFGADATTVYSQAPNGDGEVWHLSPDHLRAVACNLAGRNLTAQEWNQYLSWAGPQRATCPQHPLS